MLLVDTSVWVDYFNGHASQESEYLANCLAEDDPIVMPGIVATEILAGLRTDAEAERIASILGAFDATPEFEASDYRSAAGIYRRCRAGGEGVGSVVDCLIAQACIRHRHSLLSKDRDFAKIARHSSLRLILLG